MMDDKPTWEEVLDEEQRAKASEALLMDKVLCVCGHPKDEHSFGHYFCWSCPTGPGSGVHKFIAAKE